MLRLDSCPNIGCLFCKVLKVDRHLFEPQVGPWRPKGIPREGMGCIATLPNIRESSQGCQTLSSTVCAYIKPGLACYANKISGDLEIEDAKFMRRAPAQDEETRVRGRSPCNGRANWFRLPAQSSSFQSRFEFNCNISSSY